jgi:monovalent cation/hydrogen antiporter
VAGFRGAVSLAAALAVPHLVASGERFPGRDLIVFVTAGVIAVTLLQALILPAVVRWARLPQDTAVADELRLAQTEATEAALRALPDVAAHLGTDPDVVDRTRREYEEHLHLVHDDGDDDDDRVRRHDQDYTELRLALIARKRATALALRDEQRIDDIVLRQFQTRLDIEEVRLSRREIAD